MEGDLQEALNAFTRERKFNRKGPLCVALVMTQQARLNGLPLDSAGASDGGRRSGFWAGQERRAVDLATPWHQPRAGVGRWPNEPGQHRQHARLRRATQSVACGGQRRSGRDRGFLDCARA